MKVKQKAEEFEIETALDEIRKNRTSKLKTEEVNIEATLAKIRNHDKEINKNYHNYKT